MIAKSLSLSMWPSCLSLALCAACVPGADRVKFGVNVKREMASAIEAIDDYYLKHGRGSAFNRLSEKREVSFWSCDEGTWVYFSSPTTEPDGFDGGFYLLVTKGAREVKEIFEPPQNCQAI